MGARDLYVIELATTCNDMFAAGATDLSAPEIAREHFAGKALGREIVEGIRKRVHKVRDVLETDGLPVCLLSDTFFTRYRHVSPKTRPEARRCLPTGYGKSTAGIHLNTKADDLIYEEALRLGLASGAGKVKKVTDRAMTAMADGRLSEANTGQLLTDTRQRFAPERPELVERAVKPLPGPEA